MRLIDTHTHLYSEAFDEDREAMIERAFEVGVERFMIPAIDSTYTEGMYALEDKYPGNMHLMAGLHPTHVKEETLARELDHVKNQLETRGFCAVGEIGIDLYWEKSTLDIQKSAFKQQISWAKAKNLPIVIHCRDAFDEVFGVLESEKAENLRGVFHCFTGTLQQAHQALSYNMKLGIGGVVTFKNGKIDQFLDQIDIEHIVLETDAPYLAPAPFRGKRNESAYIDKVAQKLAGIYNLPVEEVAEITAQNALKIFDLANE
mgnify:FL=1